MQKLAHQIHSFDNFTLDLTRGCLLHDGEEIKLRPQTFATLKFLVENSGRLISKEELIKAVWPEWNASDNQLARCLSEVRHALGDDEQHYVKTVPRRGYIFDAPVDTGISVKGGRVYSEEIEGLKLVFEEKTDEFGEALPARSFRQPGRLPAPGRWKLSRSFLTVFGLTAGLLILLTYVLFPARSKPVVPAAKPPQTIAVLPFKPMNQVGQDEFLELGMADALITKLSNLREIVVRPTSAVRKYAGQEQDPAAAGRELRVTSVLEGNIQRLNDRIRVTVQLVSVQDGSPLWAEKFDEKFGDIFSVQDSISQKIAERLALKLTGEDMQRLTKRYTQNAEAYQLYVKGVFYRDELNEEGLQKAVQYFEEAIKVDPNYAQAYAGLSSALAPMMFFGFLPYNEGRPRMLAAETKALELDDTLAEAQTESGVFKLYYEYDWSGGEHAFKRAIELNPSYALAHHMYANLLEGAGRFDEAIVQRKRALEIDPLSLRTSSLLGWDYTIAGRYEEAIAQYGKTSELDPNYPLIELGQVYERKGMNDEAIAEYLKQKARSGKSAAEIDALKAAYAAAGMKGYWLECLKEKAKQKPVRSLELAGLYARTGQKDQAFEWLVKAYEEHDPRLILLKVDPPFEGLRSDARFADLMRRVGLSQ
jgi:TolB-like protein/DNA-binding winged helix-turn-helix (wHTH) protein/Tfp pilus assembly protein PilF